MGDLSYAEYTKTRSSIAFFSDRIKMDWQVVCSLRKSTRFVNRVLAEMPQIRTDDVCQAGFQWNYRIGLFRLLGSVYLIQ